ncbi:hypothetical protein MNBD_ALPHA09-194 [hydrothermal vent metagenome]|uniref:Uncharacterized protein n=1 Tax=hydrothermal vent metagenome TaxID=652676 RepID=A0A3B0TSE6_9ZZZZ
MDIAKLSDRVTHDLRKAISAELSLEERLAIEKIVVQALLDATGKTHEAYKSVASKCCGPEADLAHKIQAQMDKKRDMLIANLVSMR